MPFYAKRYGAEAFDNPSLLGLVSQLSSAEDQGVNLGLARSMAAFVRSPPLLRRAMKTRPSMA